MKLESLKKRMQFGGSQKLMLRYPNSEIVLCTPLHRLEEEVGECRLRDYVVAIREVAQNYGVPVCDLYANCNMQPQLQENMERFMPDGLHPNDEGQAKIYKRLRGFLEAL